LAPSAIRWRIRSHALQIAMFIAVGNDGARNQRPENQYKDIDMEAHLLFNCGSRVHGISAELRVYDGRARLERIATRLR
jgi:hypothetical protein